MSVVVATTDTIGHGYAHLFLHLTQLDVHISVYLPSPFSKKRYNIKSADYDAKWGDIINNVTIASIEDGNIEGLSEAKIREQWTRIKTINDKNTDLQRRYPPLKICLFGKSFTCATMTARLLIDGDSDHYYKINPSIVFPGTLMQECRKLKFKITNRLKTVSTKPYTPPRRSPADERKRAEDDFRDRLTHRMMCHF